MWRNDRFLHLFLFFLLVLTSTALRLYESGTFSLSNDELSAVSRLQYDNLTDLLKNGVAATDPHPAGVQIFLFYWTKFFGISAFSLRLPFILAATLALIFMYLAFKNRFGSQAALLALSFFSFTSFTLIQSQLARPYTFGFLFTMILFWSQTEWLHRNRSSVWIKIVFVVSAVLSCYTHYFAAMFAGIIGLTGLVPAFRKKVLKTYLICGVLVLVLFLPHFPITLSQLNRGPLTNWIEKPDGIFLFSHIFYLLNESFLQLVIYLFLVTLSLQNCFRDKKKSEGFFYQALTLFLLPVIFGYLYSLFSGPVLMHRVLFFSSPFFFGLAVLNLPQLKTGKFLILFSVICSTMLADTLLNSGFLKRNYVENFKSLAGDLKEILDEKRQDVWLAGNFNSPEYLNYYEPLASDKFSIHSLGTDKELAEYMKLVRDSEKNKMGLFHACTYQPIAAIEYARIYYPTLLKHKSYYNSGMWYFSKEKHFRDTLLNIKTDSTLLNQETEYFNLLEGFTGNFSGIRTINVRLKFEGKNPEGFLLVFSINYGPEREALWQGHHLTNFVTEDGENEIFMSFKIPENSKSEDKLNIYIWNSKGGEIRIGKTNITAFSDGIYPDLY